METICVCRFSCSGVLRVVSRHRTVSAAQRAARNLESRECCDTRIRFVDFPVGTEFDADLSRGPFDV